MRVKSTICACCEYNLPYIIPNEYSNKSIGVFGDSFCALADIKNYNIEGVVNDMKYNQKL